MLRDSSFHKIQDSSSPVHVDMSNSGNRSGVGAARKVREFVVHEIYMKDGQIRI